MYKSLMNIYDVYFDFVMIQRCIMQSFSDSYCAVRQYLRWVLDNMNVTLAMEITNYTRIKLGGYFLFLK